MTDKQIMQALNCCTSKSISCQKCPLLSKSKCERELIHHSFDLINGQQSEIERLESIINTDNQMIKSLNKCYEISKTEAIKEFAEKLKDVWFDNRFDSPDIDFDYFIDNLVKEMGCGKQ